MLRRIALLLISLLAIGQAHLCNASYELPDGQTCLTCPTLEDSDQHQETISEASHGDCHDCCVLNSCDGQDQKVKASLSGAAFSFDICLPQPLKIDFSALTLTVERQVYIESAPSTGPPGRQNSRAPPCCHEPSSSAGCRFMKTI